MEVLRYKYVFTVITLLLSCVSNEQSTLTNSTTPNCPLSKIIEDIFKGHNKSNERGFNLDDRDRVKLFLNAVANITSENTKKKHDDLVNDIIASINRIKSNISNTTDKLNEAIILAPETEISSNMQKLNQIKSGIEEKTDTINHNSNKKETTSDVRGDITTEKTKYVEILTIEPNNTIPANTSHNIIEVLKHLMPLFNNTLTNKLHNITIIEKDNADSFSVPNNVSTIIVTYCDKDNSSVSNSTVNTEEANDEYDYYNDEDSESNVKDDENAPNMTVGEKRDIMEAANYGMQKMHELYSVLEPKLYSMGLWLDDTNPARYVAAFNAPSEEAARFSRYGYASLQAATKLKELTRLWDIFKSANDHLVTVKENIVRKSACPKINMFRTDL